MGELAGTETADTGQRFPDTGRGQHPARDVDRELAHWGDVPGQGDLLGEDGAVRSTG